MYLLRGKLCEDIRSVSDPLTKGKEHARAAVHVYFTRTEGTAESVVSL